MFSFFHIYGFLIGIGVLLAFEVSSRVAKKQGLDQMVLDSVFWFVLIGGIVGARAYHVIDYWQRYYQFNLLKTLFVWEGGLGIWGGIIGGAIGLWIYKWLKAPKSIRLLKVMDCVVVGVPLAQAIGRLGNYFNNELWGINHLPLFAIESVLDLILFGILWKLAARVPKSAVITGSYFVGYGIIRFCLEWLRPTETIWKIAGFPTASIISIAAIGSGILFIWWSRR